MKIFFPYQCFKLSLNVNKPAFFLAIFLDCRDIMLKPSYGHDFYLRKVDEVIADVEESTFSSCGYGLSSLFTLSFDPHFFFAFLMKYHRPRGGQLSEKILRAGRGRDHTKSILIKKTIYKKD